jgi:chromosome segregation ATPase
MQLESEALQAEDKAAAAEAALVKAKEQGQQGSIQAAELASAVEQLKAALEESTQKLAAAEAAAQQVPGLQLELKEAREQLSMAKAAADQLPSLQEALASAQEQAAAQAAENAEHGTQVKSLLSEAQKAQQTLTGLEQDLKRAKDDSTATELTHRQELNQVNGCCSLLLCSKSILGHCLAWNSVIYAQCRACFGI